MLLGCTKKEVQPEVKHSAVKPVLVKTVPALKLNKEAKIKPLTEVIPYNVYTYYVITTAKAAALNPDANNAVPKLEEVLISHGFKPEQIANTAKARPKIQPEMLPAYWSIPLAEYGTLYQIIPAETEAKFNSWKVNPVLNKAMQNRYEELKALTTSKTFIPKPMITVARKEYQALMALDSKLKTGITVPKPVLSPIANSTKAQASLSK